MVCFAQLDIRRIKNDERALDSRESSLVAIMQSLESATRENVPKPGSEGLSLITALSMIPLDHGGQNRCTFQDGSSTLRIAWPLDLMLQWSQEIGTRLSSMY
jgi:hypothetical protein